MEWSPSMRTSGSTMGTRPASCEKAAKRARARAFDSMHLTVGIPSPMVITARHLVKRAPITTYSSSLSRSPSSPCVYFSPGARGRSTVLLSTLMPGTTPCLSRTCGSGVPSEDSWRMVSSKRITPERYSPMPPVVKSISLYCRRLSSVESMSTALKRFSMVPKLSSAARMPLPSGTSSLAVLSSCCKCMISPLFSFLPQGQLLAKRITNVPCSVAGSLLAGWVESSSRTRFSAGTPPSSLALQRRAPGQYPGAQTYSSVASPKPLRASSLSPRAFRGPPERAAPGACGAGPLHASRGPSLLPYGTLCRSSTRPLPPSRSFLRPTIEHTRSTRRQTSGWGRALPDARPAAGGLSGWLFRWHAPRDVPRRDAAPRRGPRRDHALRRYTGYAEHPFRPLCQLRLHHRRLAKESGEPLVPGRFRVQGVYVAGVGPLQGVVENADQIVVLIAGAGSLLAGVHESSSSKSSGVKRSVPAPGVRQTVAPAGESGGSPPPGPPFENKKAD